MLTLFIGAALDLGALIIANIIIFALIGRSDKAEKDLRRSEELFGKILEGINDGIFDYDVPANTISYSQCL